MIKEDNNNVFLLAKDKLLQIINQYKTTSKYIPVAIKPVVCESIFVCLKTNYI